MLHQLFTRECSKNCTTRYIEDLRDKQNTFLNGHDTSGHHFVEIHDSLLDADPVIEGCDELVDGGGEVGALVDVAPHQTRQLAPETITMRQTPLEYDIKTAISCYSWWRSQSTNGHLWQC